ncbi:MAG: YeeE/YedE family protein [Candidatus Omnitrophica bacterium]|nr:YeeE/YedE family protein [Candidatus Omnitrophota bacterium]
MSFISSFLAGIVMAWGLCISQMVNPAKVIAFLDIFGRWDPSLALVMVGALLVTTISFRLILRREKPVYEKQFFLPVKKEIDPKLIFGSILFGIGWGLSGFCPAPAIAGLAFGIKKSIVFVTFMLIGMILYKLIFEKNETTCGGSKS